MAVAFTENPPLSTPKLQPIWHRSAPKLVRINSTNESPFGDWAAWQKHLARRKQPVSPPFLEGKAPALLWGWPSEWHADDIAAALASTSGIQSLALRYMLAQVETEDVAATADLSLALQFLAMVYGLPQLASQLPPETWWALVERLHALASEAQHQRIDWPGDPRDVVRQQLLAAEMPLALGYLFPEIRGLRALRKEAMASFSEALLELTDGEGLPHAGLLPVLGPIFACWTRARWLGERLDRGSWSRKAEVQYQWLVRRVIRLADSDGRFVLSAAEQASPAWTKPMVSMAVKLVGDRGDCAAAADALPSGIVPKKRKFDRDDLPDPSMNSDWSGIAVLAGGWSPADVRLAVAYADSRIPIELGFQGESLLAGELKTQTTCDGRPVRIDGEWERLCWESGKRYDFLELGIDLSDGLRLERQFLLGRQDSVLYIADVVSSIDDEPRHLEHSLKLPLDTSAAWQPEVETRDGLIICNKARAAVMPLALKEWRSDPRSGSLAEESGYLALSQEIHGRALCCALLIDLDRKRAKKERTWRQLTVGEALEIVPNDLAVAFRAQSGRDQWLFYRSLGSAGNRTFLGQNTSGEFSAGPFLTSGKYKEWLEIEAV